MECGQCIFDRMRNKGMWDRFGTTWEQEIEALCDKHLLETYRVYADLPEAMAGLAIVEKEIIKRKLTS